MPIKQFLFIATSMAVILASSCSRKKDQSNEEQIKASSPKPDSTQNDSTLNSVSRNLSMKQILSYPSAVVITGIVNHRLVTIYKTQLNANASVRQLSESYSYSEGNEDEMYSHYMPGIDILYGYNLLNIAHYGMKSDQKNFLFGHPVLVKTLYFPSLTKDSLNGRPVNRTYYLVSVYDEDTNKDTLINQKDLRRFYHFDSTGVNRTQLIPDGYSVVKSQYDSQNDAMFIFARQDENKNGTSDKLEPLHIFWISLKDPAKAKLLY